MSNRGVAAAQRSLFDSPAPTCVWSTHRESADMRPTVTVWSGETIERDTATCIHCGFVRGRWPSEFQQ